MFHFFDQPVNLHTEVPWDPQELSVTSKQQFYNRLSKDLWPSSAVFNVIKLFSRRNFSVVFKQSLWGRSEPQLSLHEQNEDYEDRMSSLPIPSETYTRFVNWFKRDVHGFEI